MLSKGLELSDIEIGKQYGEIAHLISMPSYFYEKLSDEISSLINSSKGKKIKIMEYGSGNGFLAEKIISKNKFFISHYFLIDNSERLLASATNRLSNFGNDIIIESLHQSGNKSINGIKEKSIDIVVSTEVLEHLKKPDQYLRNIKKVLKDNGGLLISIPNGTAFEPYQTYITKNFKTKTIVNNHFLWQFIHGEHPIKTPQPIATMYYYDEIINLLGKYFTIYKKSGFEHKPYLYDIFRRWFFSKLRISRLTTPFIDKLQLFFDKFVHDPSKFYRTYFILRNK